MERSTETPRPRSPAQGWLGRLPARSRIAVALQIVVAVVLVGLLLAAVDVSSLVEAIASVDPRFLLGTLACLAGTVLVGAFDVWVLLGGIKPLPFPGVLRVYAIAWSSFLALPGSAGDAVQILLFKRSAIDYRAGTSVYLTDKLVTLVVNLAIVLGGGWLVLDDVVRSGVIALALGALGIGALVGLWALRRWGHLVAGSLAGRIVGVLEFAADYARRHPARILVNLAGTLTRAALTVAGSWLLFRGLGVTVGPLTILVVGYSATLVAYLPIAFNGIGTVEIAAVALYRTAGVAASSTLAMYVLLRGLIVVTALAGLVLTLPFRRATRPSRERPPGDSPTPPTL